MNSSTSKIEKTDILLKQHEQAWQEIQHEDSLYVQMALLYMAIIGAYIGSLDKFTKYPIPISVSLGLIGLCIVGAMWRIRKIIDQQLSLIGEIEKLTSMKSSPPIKGIGKIRTSTYLMTVVIIMTVLAIFLTLIQ